MKNKLILSRVLAAAIFFTFICIGCVLAQEEATPPQNQAANEEKPASQNADEDTFTVETVSGEVSWVGKDYISLIYNRDYDKGAESEVMVPITDETVLKHVKSLKDIQKGDLVSIEYNKPSEKSKGKASARSVTFIQKGVSGLVSK